MFMYTVYIWNVSRVANFFTCFVSVYAITWLQNADILRYVVSVWSQDLIHNNATFATINNKYVHKRKKKKKKKNDNNNKKKNNNINNNNYNSKYNRNKFCDCNRVEMWVMLQV